MYRKIKELFSKYREIVLYLVFGAGTTAVDLIVSYALYPTSINIHAVHTVAWISAVAFAYVTNRIFVFKSRTRGIGIILETIKFAGSRVATFLIQEAIVFLLFDVMSYSEYVVKIPAAILVIILNYLFSRILVFRGGKKHDE